MAELARRSTSEVFEDHLNKRQQKKLEEDLEANYASDVIVFCAEGVKHGHDAIRYTASLLEKAIPNAQYEYTHRFAEGEYAFLEWEANAGQKKVCDGADSFVIKEGKIVMQTIHYTVH